MRIETTPPAPRPRPSAEARDGHPEPPREPLLEEHDRHAAHQVHTGVDVARLTREAPEVAEKLLQVIARNPRLEADAAEALVKLAERAPGLVGKLLDAALAHPVLGERLLAAAPRIGKVYAEVLGKLATEFPAVSERVLARIAENSVLRGIGKAIPVLGVGIAAWGTWDTAQAVIDPATSARTKALYVVANAADWGAAIGGIFAATGVGEVAAISAAVGSIYLYAKAEASKEADHHRHQAPAPGDGH